MVAVNVRVAGRGPGSSVVLIRCSSLIVVSDCLAGGIGFQKYSIGSYDETNHVRFCLVHSTARALVGVRWPARKQTIPHLRPTVELIAKSPGSQCAPVPNRFDALCTRTSFGFTQDRVMRFTCQLKS
jgi:hypothetical protein